MNRYQVLLEPDQRKRLEEIARRERRTLASVLRQALDAGLEAIEGRSQIWERRMRILEKWRSHLDAMPLIETDLISEIRDERQREMDRLLWPDQS
jgi:predicted transcriptional regulator